MYIYNYIGVVHLFSEAIEFPCLRAYNFSDKNIFAQLLKSYLLSSWKEINNSQHYCL